MMVPKKSLILAGAALALFGAASSAQSQSGKVFARYNKPLKSASLDLATGTLTRGSVSSNRVATTCSKFDNLDFGGFVGVDTGNGFCEWKDAADKQNVNCVTNSNLMANITFAYCSSKADPNSGGPGGLVRLGFFEGYTLFGGAPTTHVAVFTLSGLPGNTASSSFFGGFNCFLIRVTFADLLNWSKGPFGWSWRFLDLGNDGLLAGTWPFLCCVVSCSGAILQVDGNGMTDVIDEYCPPGFLRASFTFGTTSGSFTSMCMAKGYVEAVTATVVLKDSVPSNPDKLSATTAVVGGTWSSTITSGFTRGAGVSQWWFGGAALASPAPIPSSFGGLNWGTSKAGRMLICNLVVQIDSVAHGALVPGGFGGAVFTPIPKDPALVCNPWCIQAIVLGSISGMGAGPHVRITDARQGVVGTF